MFSPGFTSLIEEAGPFVGQYYDHDPKSSKDYLRDVRVLVIGAGGLGCEILKCLAFNGFKHIDIIDMDLIDISNLNRQFLFRQKDIGKYKSQVAAEYIKTRVRGRFGKIKYTDENGKEIEDDIEINYKTCKIQELPDEYYLKFHIVIGGLDNPDARLWMSQKLVEIAKRSNNELCIPFIDGGTTSWSGNIMVIFPNHNACMECIRILFTEPSKYAFCSAATKPRKPEHCVIFGHGVVKDKLEKEEKIFDDDNDELMLEVVDLANAHAKEYGLPFTIDLRFARKVIKNTVPAIASTQAIVASICCTEALKLVSDCAPFLCNKVDPDIDNNPYNYVNFDGNSSYVGANFNAIKYNRIKNCSVCQDNFPKIKYNPDETVADFLKRLETDINFPNATSLIVGKQTIASTLLESNQVNLSKKMGEFGIHVGDQIGGSSLLTNKDFKAILI